MKRYDAIHCVSQAILADDFADALFLKGSIARNEDDDYSDVDLYAAVSTENMDKFLAKRLQYMQTYLPLVYWSEANFVGPQIVGVYENALHFDLYTVNTDNIPDTDEIKIIYDKNDVLKSYKKKSLSLSHTDVIREINEFSFRLLEFEIAYSRKDFIWSTRLLYAQMFHVSKLLRYIYDPGNAQLGAKRLDQHLPEDLYEEHVRVMDLSTPSNLHEAKKAVLQLMDKVLDLLPEDIRKGMNHDFYDMMHDRILRLVNNRG